VILCLLPNVEERALREMVAQVLLLVVKVLSLLFIIFDVRIGLQLTEDVSSLRILCMPTKVSIDLPRRFFD